MENMKKQNGEASISRNNGQRKDINTNTRPKIDANVINWHYHKKPNNEITEKPNRGADQKPNRGLLPNPMWKSQADKNPKSER